ncbi:ATP-dependent DNA ligase [Oceanitalea stevensii]|uniref:Probable DNA ligase n=1 Tax=Oceanitalea stevensii TaxID=2763072 RepID=A0ABR8Z517_9MICO|nr:ATP-dependent DNA ligase [Oceanitalea stevensii]MBD8063272.1 ATP-dependent DNA ligase [Oceanitalea stevensii]
MLFARLAETSTAVAATRSRLEKRALLAATLREAEGDEIDVVATYLSGRVRQRRTGVGWRSLAQLPEPAPAPSLTPTDVDAQLEAVSALAGTGSQAGRATAVATLFGALTEPEQLFLRALILGEVRQGALDSLLIEAIADATAVPVTAVRRAAMFSAFTGPVARAALTGGVDALEDFRPAVLQPVRPMLASPAPDLTAALAKLRDDDGGTPVAADGKIDGIRVQVHKAGDEVAVFTRSLDDITERVPEIVDVVRALPAEELILDGEAIALGPSGRPRPFQETASRTGSHDGAAGTTPLTVFFFDLLHRNGTTLVTAPARERLAALEEVVPASALVPRRVTADQAELDAFFREILELGHEGLVLKDLTAPYDAGRRGAAWVKVKPRHTLDLVVLAVEWGSGRRQGTLSNIHLGARDGDGFVMLGKTFKGMTDEMLAWQTERFLELETHRDGHVVHVRPEQVVEIAIDGVQRSPRYPGGVALRFARVLRYRDDKTPAEADTLDTVRTLGP